MKAIEFKATLSPSGQIMLPPEAVSVVPVGEQIQVVLLWEDAKVELSSPAVRPRLFESVYRPED